MVKFYFSLVTDKYSLQRKGTVKQFQRILMSFFTPKQQKPDLYYSMMYVALFPA